MRRFFLVLCLGVLVVPEAGLGQRTRFEDVTDVVVVEIPVQVIRDREPVRGLTAEDFLITEGRKKREIIGFDVVDLTMIEPTSASATVLPIAARRHFLFFFDLSFSDPGAIVRARSAATELVDARLHPTDLAAVASYSRSTGAKLILGFTPDREQVKLAITTLGLPQLIEAKRDPLGLTLTDLGDPLASRGLSGESSAGGGAAGLPDAEAEIQEILSAIVGAERRATSRNEILALSSALTEFAEMMQAIDGRKYVVYLSEGFDSSLVLGTRGADFEEQRQIQETNEAAMGGRYWEIDSNERFGDTNMQNQLSDMLQQFVRADCMIQAVDIGGAQAGTAAVRRQQNTQDSLFMMANDTGGEVYQNYNNLSDAMDGMLRRTSVTYVLAFQPNDLKDDGRFRKLNVKLKGGSRGARLVHRPGYFPPRSYTQMNPMEQRMSGASSIMGAPGGRIDSSVLAAPFNVGASTAYVPLLIEIDGTSLRAGTDGNVLPAELYAYAISSQGMVQDYFVQVMGLDLSKVGPALEQSGLKYWGHFDLPTGNYEVRILVRNSTTGAGGVATSRIRVPDFDSDEVLVLPPLFPEQPGKWVLGREDQARQGDYPYPFMSQDAPFIPAARPALRPGEAARISLVTYNFGGGIPDVEAAIYDADGGRLGDVEILLDQQEAGTDPSMIRYGASCEIPDVGEGIYKLEVTLVDPDSGDRQTSAIDVQVIG